MIDIVSRALTLLQRGDRLVEATVIRHQGSTPRSAGAKMIIGPDGAGYGTIGGGLLEAGAMRAAMTALETHRSQLLSFDLTGQDAAAMDMICGGRTQVLLDVIQPDPQTIAAFDQRRQAVEKGEPGLYLTIVEGKVEHIRGTVHCLIQTGCPIDPAACSLPPEMLEQVLNQGAHTTYMSIVDGADRFVVVEAIGAPKTAYLFGAGHVAVSTAHFAALLGFRVVVLDDRAAFANEQRFPQAHQILVVPDFNRAFDDIRIDDNAFVIIVTRGHIHDQTVLAKALSTDAAYIGMIGSRRKRDAIYEALLAQGFTRKDLERVHSPIGVRIDAETPEEIAVSIVAEMIQERAGITT